jgi:hypothetical protein
VADKGVFVGRAVIHALLVGSAIGDQVGEGSPQFKRLHVDEVAQAIIHQIAEKKDENLIQ